MTHFDTFSGYGGFSIALERNGIETIGFSEVDKNAVAVLKYHWPEVKNYGDITTITDLPDFDVLTGGSPCQDFSIAGKREGLGGARSSLAWEFIRILRLKKPKYFIWENVKGVMSSRSGWDFANIVSAFSESGYALWWQVLNAKDFGVPQNRERIFVVGFRDGSPKEVFFKRQDSEKTPVIPTLTSRYYGGQANGAYIRNKPQQIVGGSQGYRVYDPDGTSVTLAGQAGGIGAKTGLYAIRETEDGFHQYRNDKKKSSIQGTHITYPKGKSHALGTQHIPMTTVPAQWRRTEKGKAFRKEAQKKGKDLTPFNDGHRELVPKDSEVIGTITSTAIAKDSLLFDQAQIRRLTPLECERLMGLPDNWTAKGVNEREYQLSDSARYKLCGNGVVVNCVEEIVNNLLKPKG